MTAKYYRDTGKASRERVERLAGRRGYEHLIKLFGTLSEGVDILCVSPSRFAFHVPKHKDRRALVTIVNDDFDRARGPSAFHLRSLRKPMRKVKAVFVMAGAPIASAYDTAAEVAGDGLNVAIIETQVSEEYSWIDYIVRHAPQAGKVVVSPTARELANRAA